jgi:hypothetical protein
MTAASSDKHPLECFSVKAEKDHAIQFSSEIWSSSVVQTSKNHHHRSPVNLFQDKLIIQQQQQQQQQRFSECFPWTFEPPPPLQMMNDNCMSHKTNTAEQLIHRSDDDFRDIINLTEDLPPFPASSCQGELLSQPETTPLLDTLRLLEKIKAQSEAQQSSSSSLSPSSPSSSLSLSSQSSSSSSSSPGKHYTIPPRSRRKSPALQRHHDIEAIYNNDEHDSKIGEFPIQLSFTNLVPQIFHLKVKGDTPVEYLKIAIVRCLKFHSTSKNLGQGLIPAQTGDFTISTMRYRHLALYYDNLNYKTMRDYGIEQDTLIFLTLVD